MRIEIIPYDITRHDEPGPFCGTPGPVVDVPQVAGLLPRAGDRIVLQGRADTVDERAIDFDRQVVTLRARRWPAKVTP